MVMIWILIETRVSVIWRACVGSIEVSRALHSRLLVLRMGQKKHHGFPVVIDIIFGRLSVREYIVQVSIGRKHPHASVWSQLDVSPS